jgi:riboflavin kinase/FMN adenylyltransferase
MLKTVLLTTENTSCKGAVMLLGGFDGLHIGHKTLLAKARSFGLPVGVMTIVGGKESESLFTFAEREVAFAKNGIDFVFELPFAEIRDMTPIAFMQRLEEEFSPFAFVCGEDFRFGKNAVGSAKNIKDYTRVRVEIEELLKKDGQKISTTDIKSYIKEGQIEEANALLGEPFFLMGTVKRDRGVGKTLGFPTANISYPSGKFPLKKGVYETRVRIDGKEYRCITNYGARPTFGDENVVTETYIDGFSGDLYGKTLTVRFARYLRDIKKFNGIEELQAQLQEDIRRVRND